MKKNWAKNIITGLAHIGGFPVGLVANQPKVMGGAIDSDAADKVARFLSLAQAFGLPVVFLHDCPGFMVGSRMEKMGIIRHGAKMLFAVGELTTPKLSVVIRRSYGAGYYVMCGKGLGPDLLVGWPTSEIGLMSPEGAVNILFQEEKERALKIDQYRKLIGGPLSAKCGYLDDIIDPRQTRNILIHALNYTKTKPEKGKININQ